MGRHYAGTNFVTGLRAYAAMGVVLVHSGGGGLRHLGEFGNELADLGATGVYVFFVISGFSVSASWAKIRSFPDFFIRRLMRLAPTYYAFLLIAALLMQASVIDPNYWASSFEVPLDTYNWLLHILFLGYLDYRVNNSLIGVEWSLSVEMFWYLLIPWVLLFVEKGAAVSGSESSGALSRSLKRGLTCALVIALGIYFTNKVVVAAMVGEASQYVVQWSPLTYAPAFMLGVIAYFVRSSGGLLTGRQSDLCILLVLGLLCVQCFVSLMEIRLLIPLLTFCVLLAGRDEAGLSRLLFNNRLAIFLGTISFSLYLSHPLIIDALRKAGVAQSPEQDWLFFWVVSLTAVVVSVVTYQCFELPTNRLGRELSSRVASQAPLVTSEAR